MTKETPEPAGRRKPRASDRRARGFLRAGDLAPGALKSSGARRGFAELRLLTEWRAIVGESLAAICRPMKVTYRERGGLGAVLVLTAEGARAPEVEMEKARIIERVNAFYGYRAVSRIRIDQSRAPLMNASPGGPTGALEAEAAAPPAPISGIEDPDLALALARLGANIRAKAARTAAAGQNTNDPKRSSE